MPAGSSCASAVGVRRWYAPAATTTADAASGALGRLDLEPAVDLADSQHLDAFSHGSGE